MLYLVIVHKEVLTLLALEIDQRARSLGLDGQGLRTD